MAELPVPPMSQPEGSGSATSGKPRLFLLDYGAGNVRSLANSIKKLGYDFEWIQDASDFDKADKLLFPGVGAFGQAMKSLQKSGLRQPLIDYIRSGKPYFGICIGMQALFETSAESPDDKGLGIIPASIGHFERTDQIASGGRKSVPHMGWGSIRKAWQAKEQELMLHDEQYYFVHSYRVSYNDKDEALAPFIHTLTRYGSEQFVSSVRRGNIFGTQFHPEKSGSAGLDLLKRWLEATPEALVAKPSEQTWAPEPYNMPTAPTRRIVACLDVRSNDQGDLVVTKGDQYDVREAEGAKDVRNLGKPVELSQRYYHEGADEVAFLNITSFRNSALQDQPMLEVVRSAAETVFVPLTIGGGIKDTVDPDGTKRSALEVASAYFRAGADKVSIGSEAVIAVEEMLQREAKGETPLSGQTGIETIAEGYGSQAVVVSIDPKRVYVDTSKPDWEASFPSSHRACLIKGDEAISATAKNEQGKAWWYQCTIRGGREVRDVDVVQLAQGVERLGAGEILLNSVDRDGTGLGFDLDLVRLVKQAVSIPVIASSGAGKPSDFTEVFEKTNVEAALAAGIFHRKEVPLEAVKEQLRNDRLSVRTTKLSIV